MAEEAKTTSKRKVWLSSLGFIAVLLASYFAYVEVQTRLGQKVLMETGLTSLTLKNALAAAQQENKQVLVDLSAIWCPTCRRLDKEIFSNDAVKSLIESDYIFSRIEYEPEEGEKFMAKYQIKGFPSLLLLDARGNKLKKLSLTFDPQSFISQLKK